MQPVPFSLSRRAVQTEEPPISYFMRMAVENPGLISLAAGLVDAESLPAAEIKTALDAILADPAAAKVALQYGTTQGYLPLREKILSHVLALDGVAASDVALSPDDVVVTTGSQQLLYTLGELLLDPGDIVITEGPSYFVYHGTLTSLGVRTLSVPMDENGMDTDALEALLADLERRDELGKVKLIYTVDYFQNPTGLTLSLPRRQHLLELAQRFSKTNRIFILEDAAYRELRYDGADLPSVKSFDRDNRHVVLGMTFSKPTAPGLKTGYGILPDDLMGPFLRFKGNHDFGSSNLNQHVLDRLLADGSYDRHVRHLGGVYRAKRDAMLDALAREFPPETGVRWTVPEGGIYVWLTTVPGLETGPDGCLMQAALDAGVMYVPGAFCYVKGQRGTDDLGARLCFATASPARLDEAIRRLGAAARAVTPRELARV